MTFTLPPIVKLAERLLVCIEQAVRRFPRYHKYTIGADLRASAMHVCETTHRAWRDRGQQAQWVHQLVFAIDDLRIRLQLASRVRAFGSFREFEMLARLASDLGKQAGGWHRQQHPKGQNAGARTAPQQRAQILSTRAASIGEANA
jgi:hypothetical protein